MTATASIPLATPVPVFDLVLALKLAEWSRRAYPENPCQDHVNVCTVICDPATNAQVLMAEESDCRVLAFRGTHDARDWFTDFKIEKKALAKGVMVHAGFLAAADSLMQKIIGWLNGGTKPLLITGHSLGGALAALAAFTLQHSNFPIRAVYTFASPRVGNGAWRTSYDGIYASAPSLGAKTFRVVCAGDLVPLVPGIFTTFRDGYRHCGTEVLLADGIYHVSPSHYWEIALDGWRAYRALKRGDWDFILQAHSITEDYIATLNRIQEREQGNL